MDLVEIYHMGDPLESFGNQNWEGDGAVDHPFQSGCQILEETNNV